MAIKISNTKLESFVGDVLPLWLEAEGEDISDFKIKWTLDGDAVTMRCFGGPLHASFEWGVLLTFVKEGCARISARIGDAEYVCEVVARAARHCESAEAVNYYQGDFHDHTSTIHNHDAFLNRKSEFQTDYLKAIKDDGRLDFAVESDHSDVLNLKDFFRSFTAAEQAKPMNTVIFPGSESEINNFEYDRFGLVHKYAGEIVVVNSDNFCFTKTYEEFVREFRESPFVVATLAHPQILGSSSQGGMWNFRLDKHNSDGFKRLIKLVEFGNGADRCSNLVHEYVYSTALDNGFRVGGTCSSDSHSTWGFDVFPGKTIIMAPEKSKEAFLDALLNNRVYCCESGNLKLRYTVNGRVAPADVAVTDKYSFKIEFSYFKEDSSTHPVVCELISDYGKALKIIDCKNADSIEFDIESDSARYFYLRLADSEGRRTWSVPVWTGRAFDKTADTEPRAIDKTNFKAKNLTDGKDLSTLINGNPAQSVLFDSGNAEIVIDMGDERDVSALGHYAPITSSDGVRAQGIIESVPISRFALDYEISVSCDGVSYTSVKEGIFRAFGGEEIVRFEKCKARYVKLNVKSTVGKRSYFKKYENARLEIAELSLFD